MPCYDVWCLLQNNPGDGVLGPGGVTSGLWRMRESALREEGAGGWEPEGPWALLSASFLF